ncbi:hypothetical protein ACIBCR_26345 [Micromonospora echinospora]|uniref:hypothetical protein n=1 Tax=Micromonospora TaxID=1873 RepID=UPI0024A5CA24|nr:hypothetical protein [Micromonospora sp. NBRC 101691]GLY20433.1 hypothetical protein Misp04_01650 [Micromonospora sp. NBRC 101691]
MNGPLDLTALDLDEVSWTEQTDETTNLYAVAPTGSISVTEGANDGRSCCGGGCGGRPIQWCCINCH